MKIAIVAFAGFNEIDSIAAAHILNRVHQPGWKAEIIAPPDTINAASAYLATDKASNASTA